jgi:DNA-binding transcriptional regulator YiaG
MARTEVPPTVLAGKIVGLRTRLRLSQVQLAGMLGVHFMQVSKWERGVAVPSHWQAEILRRIAKYRGSVDIGTHIARHGSIEALVYVLTSGD